jgi:Ni,Fe-hydrogenase III small subunit
MMVEDLIKSLKKYPKHSKVVIGIGNCNIMSEICCLSHGYEVGDPDNRVVVTILGSHNCIEVSEEKDFKPEVDEFGVRIY